jgi:CheY-like chemotaxis protein
MHLQSLLLSGDAEIVRVLRPTLEKLSINMEVCRVARSANDVLCSEKFDAVIVDCDDVREGIDVLRGLRNTPSNRTSVAFALLNGSTTTQQAFDLGANFVLQKPISPLNASRCFSAAIGLMARERRRYFRHPVNMGVIAMFGDTQVKARATNLSEGGMAVLFEGNPPRTGGLKLSFTLPGTMNAVEAKAELAWLDEVGRGGIRFFELPQTSRQYLDRWLDQHMEAVDR